MLLSGQELYEEKLRDTLPLREKLYVQLNTHADRQLLKTRIGYPPPAMKASGTLRLDRIAEDATATY